ncbi:MAG: hypothetical protein DA407_09980 [Bacteroidetes bacterium]|nr:MAG: hypothetical protein DA407_09980 [Bacteroidota bacterium]
MQRSILLSGIIIALTISFIGFQIFQLDLVGAFVRGLILPLLTVLYCISGKSKSNYFFYFLIFYSISEFSGVFSYFAYYSVVVDYLLYYVGNLSYITAYIFLILEVLKSINLKTVLSRFPVHIIILLVLDIYSVYLVSEIAVKSDYLTGMLDYFIEIFYNIVIMLLLTVTLINYISRDSKKAMNLLLGALCIVFSEIIQVAYFYVSDKNILNVTYSVLLVFAFCFFYIQAGMSYSRNAAYNDKSSINNLET